MGGSDVNRRMGLACVIVVAAGAWPAAAATGEDPLRACCFSDGTCLDLPLEACDGCPGEAGSSCLGDLNANGVDDACEGVLADTRIYGLDGETPGFFTPVLTIADSSPSAHATLSTLSFGMAAELLPPPADPWAPVDPFLVERADVEGDPADDPHTAQARIYIDSDLYSQVFFRADRHQITISTTSASPEPGDVEDIAVHGYEYSHDPLTGQTRVWAALENQGVTGVPGKVLLVLAPVGGPWGATQVWSPDGYDPYGNPLFDYTHQVPGESFDAGEHSAMRPIVFYNPYGMDISVHYRVITEPRDPLGPVVVEMPTDAHGRSMAGTGEGVVITVQDQGTTDPRSFDLGQELVGYPSEGVLFFGEYGEATSATVVTSGGPENEATIRVRGDPEHPSAFVGDVRITVSEGGSPVGAKVTTALDVAWDTCPCTLQNDIPLDKEIQTVPPVHNLDLAFATDRRHRANSPMHRYPAGPSVLSVETTPSVLVTDHLGECQVTLAQGPAGPGSVPMHVFSPEFGAEDDCDAILTAPCKSCLANSVSAASGEKILRATDLSIPGRGMDYAFRRVYRSQARNLRSVATGDFAVDWCMAYSDDRLIPDGNHVIVMRSSFRTDLFTGTPFPGRWEAPPEHFEQLTTNQTGRFELRKADGVVSTYAPFDDPDIPGRLIRREDRNGNFMSFLYEELTAVAEPKFVLASVVDTLGREIRYAYFTSAETNPGRHGRLKEIEDFRRDNSPTGRKVQFDYDAEGNLVLVTGPAVVGTPTGNDFAGGKAYAYTYLTEGLIHPAIAGQDRERLLHNLLTVTYPNETAVAGPARETVAYGVSPAEPLAFDRALTYTVGGLNAGGVPAGGTWHYIYQQLADSITGPCDPFLQVTISDPAGNLAANTYGACGALLEEQQHTRGLRNGEPAAFVTAYQYDQDKNLTQTILPSGSITDNAFDPFTSDRFQQGNLTETRHTPDARGGDQTQLVTRIVYEPVYQQVASETDPRGWDPTFVPPVVDPGGRTQAERYTTRVFFDYQEGDSATVLALLAEELNVSEPVVQSRLGRAGIVLGLGDLNEDGDTTPRINGNAVRREAPAVALSAGSNQAAIEGDQLQECVTLYRYNARGQLTSEVDPEGNVHTRSYFAETDPDGDGTLTPAPADGRTLDATTGGYLFQEVRDDSHLPGANNNNGIPPAQIARSYTYDDVGNRISETDARGIRTDRFVNELNQVVQRTRAAAVPPVSPEEPLPLVAFAYLEQTFYDANDNVVQQRVEDRGDTSNTGGFVDSTWTRDILDRPVQLAREVDVTKTLVTRYRYDANGNRTLEIEPEGNARTMRYDERNLLFQSTRGAQSATPETLGAPAGPYNPRGGTPATITSNYDLNGKLLERVDAADTDGSPANNSTIAGTGDATLRAYDGFDRLTVRTDAVGNETLYAYDPAGNLIRETRRGPVGGASPTDQLGAANVDLGTTEQLFDERNRVIRRDRQLFIPSGVVLLGAPALTEGSLLPGDSRINSVYEYDRKARLTFEVHDDGDTYLRHYDGADRVVHVMDPAGNTVDDAYDDNNNLIERRETDVCQVAAVPDEVFLSTFFYDSLNRLQRRVDNLGRSMEYRYDSRNNLVAVADAQGPLTGASIARRAFPGGPLTVNTVNDFGNVTVTSYDGRNRILQQDRVLTASGQGDGLHIGADLFGVKTSTPTPDVGQSADGIVRVRYGWDDNSLAESLTDDNGNQTQYAYDNLNRRISITRGIVVSPALADRDDPDTATQFQHDPDGNLVGAIDENGSVLNFTWDAANRQIACAALPAAGVIGTTQQTTEYDGLSRKTRCTDNNDPGDPDDDATVAVSYDSLGRVIEETQQLGTGAVHTVGSSWHAADQRVRLDYPNGRALLLTYDALDRLDTITDDGAPDALADYDYIGVHRVARRRAPLTGVRLTYLNDDATTDVGYDGLRRPVQLRHLKPDHTLLVGCTHAYDRMNNRTEEDKLHDPDNREVYTYDSVYRLTGFLRPEPAAAAPLQSVWQLDGPGNWPQVDGEVRQHSSFNELIQRDGTALLHDDNGNRLDDGTLQYAWDAHNRLRSVTRKSDGLVIARYLFDARNRRISTEVTNSGPLNGRTGYTYDGHHVIQEHDAAGQLTHQVVHGRGIDECLVVDHDQDGNGDAIGPGDRRLYCHQNAMNSVYALTDDQTNVVRRYQYDAYGQPAFILGAGTVDNPFLFTGRRYDEETSLYHVRHRQYDPMAGRFISRDPIGRRTRGAGLYEYAGGNPLSRFDPLGLFDIDFQPIEKMPYHVVPHERLQSLGAGANELGGLTKVFWRFSGSCVKCKKPDNCYKIVRVKLEVRWAILISDDERARRIPGIYGHEQAHARAVQSAVWQKVQELGGGWRNRMGRGKCIHPDIDICQARWSNVKADVETEMAAAMEEGEGHGGNVGQSETISRPAAGVLYMPFGDEADPRARMGPRQAGLPPEMEQDDWVKH